MRQCSIEGCDRKHSARGMCGKHYREEYRRRNPNAFKEWRERNIERDRENSRKWRRENAERAKETSAKWRAENPDKVREFDRNRYQRDREKRIEIVMHRWHLERAGGEGERFTLLEIAERDGWRCHLCGKRVTKETWSMDHLVPISYDGEHTRTNVALAHRRCNSARGNRGAAQLRLVG